MGDFGKMGRWSALASAGIYERVLRMVALRVLLLENPPENASLAIITLVAWLQCHRDFVQFVFPFRLVPNQFLTSIIGTARLCSYTIASDQTAKLNFKFVI